MKLCGETKYTELWENVVGVTNSMTNKPDPVSYAYLRTHFGDWFYANVLGCRKVSVSESIILEQRRAEYYKEKAAENGSDNSD
jgi:TPR repeat protein